MGRANARLRPRDAAADESMVVASVHEQDKEQGAKAAPPFVRDDPQRNLR
jgi:hypothetical protein